MRAAWYETQGAPDQVLVVGTLDDPMPGPGEVRIRLSVSGINPGDLKKREDAFSVGMPYSRVVPHSDGAGIIDGVGSGVPQDRIGQRVWCFGAQSARPFGTAAEYTVVPAEQAVPLPANVDFSQGACLGIPAITAHKAVYAGGPIRGRVVLVQGGAGAVGAFAVGFARRAGAQVIASVRSAADADHARLAGADHIVRMDGIDRTDAAGRVLRIAPRGVNHIVDVAFDVNIDFDEQVLALGGSIAAYATVATRPTIPFWPLLFKNARIFLLGSDGFPQEEKQAAAQETNAMFAEGWSAVRIAQKFPLQKVAEAHRYAEARPNGRVVVVV